MSLNFNQKISLETKKNGTLVKNFIKNYFEPLSPDGIC